MIRIYRTNPGPERLKKSGQLQTERDCTAFDEAPEEYTCHRRTFVDKKYYSRKYVKDVLMRAHRNKCCYCETKLYTPGYLHVEHFRPKGAVRQSSTDSNKFPGYYWLAYCWENLLLACLDCNTIKGTVFPLDNPEQRARSHNDDLTREHERFVDPSREDPRDHIRFDRDLPIHKTERGRHTIEGLGLRSAALTEQRLQRIQEVNNLIYIVKITEAHPSPDNEVTRIKARELLKKAMQPDAPFSSMVMDLVEPLGF